VYTHVSTVPDMYVPADFAKILAPLWHESDSQSFYWDPAYPQSYNLEEFMFLYVILQFYLFHFQTFLSCHSCGMNAGIEPAEQQSNRGIEVVLLRALRSLLYSTGFAQLYCISGVSTALLTVICIYAMCRQQYWNVIPKLEEHDKGRAYPVEPLKT
jgi:hypothetical protein